MVVPTILYLLHVFTNIFDCLLITIINLNNLFTYLFYILSTDDYKANICINGKIRLVGFRFLLKVIRF